MSPSGMTPRDLFEQALLLDSPDHIEEFLDKACGSNVELRIEVDKLLAVHAKAGEFLGAYGEDETSFDPSSPIPEEKQLGPYKLLEVIGEGGMGTVYMAQQSEPVSRKVALKVIKSGMDTKQVIARFEAERQALALMDHPSIAKVLDAGATQSGRPYFVMELVKGKPITEFCDEQQLDLDSRLRLFQKVCQAVQHAHQKGIIHRDLKPSNVLVAMYDDQPVPKVIDFGVAKATGDELTEKTMFTRFGQIMGTLDYMSPEQAQFNNLDIDTRSDIYSLGAILYELLAGEPPFEREKIKNQALDETLRMIRQGEPTRPSTRLGSDSRSAQVAANRKLGVERLGSLLRGDLDWIVLKAIEKDRRQRYGTANALAKDIDRFLKNEPVSATPPRLFYRLQKFTSRNKAGITLAVAIFLFLAFGACGLIISNRLLKEKQTELTAALSDAEINLAKAEEEAEYSKAISDFLTYDLLAFSSPFAVDSKGFNEEGNRPTTVAQLLDRAAEKLASKTDLSPMAEAQLKWIVGVSFADQKRTSDAIDYFESALKIFEQELGKDDENSVKVRHHLALAHGDGGNYKQAISLAKENLGHTNDRKNVPFQFATIASLTNVFNNVGRFHETCNISLGLFFQTDLPVERARRHIIEIGLDLGYALLREGQYAQALEVTNRTQSLIHQAFDHNHIYAMSVAQVLALIQSHSNRHEEAINTINEAVESARTRFGDHNWFTISLISTSASCLARSGKQKQAEQLNELVHRWALANLIGSSQSKISAIAKIASWKLQDGDVVTSIKLLGPTVDEMEKVFGANHPLTIIQRYELAKAKSVVIKGSVNHSELLESLSEMLTIAPDLYGSDSSITQRIKFETAECYLNLGKEKEAMTLLDQLIGDVNEEEFTSKIRPSLGHALRLRGETRIMTGAIKKGITDLNLAIMCYRSGNTTKRNHVLKTQHLIASAHWIHLNFDDAILYLERLLQSSYLDPNNQEHVVARTAFQSQLASYYADAGRLKNAVELLDQIVPAFNNSLAWGRLSYIDAQLTCKQEEKAKPFVEDHVQYMNQQLLEGSMALAENQRKLAEVYFLPTGKLQKAQDLLETSLSVSRVQAPNNYQTFRTMALLGEVFLAKGELDNSREFITKGRKGLVEKMGSIAPRHRSFVTKAIEIEIEIYQKLNAKEPSEKHQQHISLLKERLNELVREVAGSVPPTRNQVTQESR